MAQPDEVLLGKWLIQAKLMAQRVDLRLRHFGVGAEHKLHSIARDQTDHQETQQRHAERYEQQITATAQQRTRHHLLSVASRSPSSERVGLNWKPCSFALSAANSVPYARCITGPSHARIRCASSYSALRRSGGE